MMNTYESVSDELVPSCCTGAHGGEHKLMTPPLVLDVLQVSDRSPGRSEGGSEEDAQRVPEPGVL